MQYEHDKNYTILPPDHQRILINWVHVIYALYALGFVSGITPLIGVIIAYVKQDSALGTWLESHLRWQISTFWYWLLFIIVGGITWIILIGKFILMIGSIFAIYRIIKGWICLIERKIVV